MGREGKHFPVFSFVPGGDFPKPEYHLGISYIRAALKEIHGISSSQIVGNPKENIGNLVKKIIQSRPTVVGFAVYDNNFLVTSTVSHMISESLPNIPIVFGGPTATFSPNECLSLCPWIDCCVEGEGETAFTELIKHYMLYGHQEAPFNIPGIYYREDGKIQYSGERSLVGIDTSSRTSLDVLPSPYLSGILNAGNQAGILTSRGCIYKCTFCNFTSMSRFRIRYHSVERILSEIEAIARTTYNGTNLSVYIYDDAFGLDLKRAKEILHGIINGKFGLRFSCLVRAELVNEEFIELLHKANFFYVGFGLESTDPHVLHLAKKVPGSDLNDMSFRQEKKYIESIREKVTLTEKLGIESDVSVILGLPGDTMESARKTLKDVHGMPCTWYTHNILSVYPGTELFRTCGNFGISLENPEKGPPYITKYAFPVKSIKFSDRSKTSQMSLQLTLRLGRIIANIASGGTYLTDLSPGINSLLTWKDLSEYAKFIRNTVAQLGTFLKFCGENEKNYDFRKDESEYCISRPYYFASEKSEPLLRNNRNIIIFNSLRENIVNYYPTLCIGPYADLKPRSEPFMGGTGEKTIISIATFFDSIDKSRFLEDLMNRGNFQKALAEISSKCDFFMDSCKWAEVSCRGQNSSGIAVDENGEERICYSSPGFPLWTEVPEIAKFMQIATKSAQERRGCRECSIKDHCSCCPFPQPMTEEEFCETSHKTIKIKKYLSMGPLDYSLRFVI